ncbi:MAG: hypothetical protein CBC29_04940 [Methylococcaceae bacterium TMED69]|nr:MAG: hypothetical protein CBC29_04940 [Methylococcaceae bacterium TMED69]
MFTGIVSGVGQITEKLDLNESVKLRITCPNFGTDDIKVGDSISVSGACLTVISKNLSGFSVDVSIETLNQTTIGEKIEGGFVNLEKSMKVDDRFGGHLVTGHVDDKAKVIKKKDLSEYVLFQIQPPLELMKYIAKKGSVCIDGVSLTVNATYESFFELLLIPHTLEVTTLRYLEESNSVNLEIDLIARYLEKLASGRVQ